MINLKEITISGITIAIQLICQTLKQIIVTNICKIAVRLQCRDRTMLDQFFSMMYLNYLGPNLSDVVIDGMFCHTGEMGQLLNDILSNKIIRSYTKVLRFKCGSMRG